MLTNKDKIGGFVNSLYWSSSEVAPANAYIQSMVAAHTANDDKNYLFYVRAVRSVSTITINNLEVLSTDLATLEWDEANKACAVPVATSNLTMRLYTPSPPPSFRVALCSMA